MWSDVHAELARTTRVCVYDRAGYNWSDAGPRPRTGQQAVSELVTLLDRTGTPLPVVIVGHSYGGQLAVEFALLYPDRVAGLVLVDASHPSTMDHVPEQFNGEVRSPAMRTLLRAGFRVGLGRIVPSDGMIPGNLAPEDRDVARAFYPTRVPGRAH